MLIIEFRLYIFLPADVANETLYTSSGFDGMEITDLRNAVRSNVDKHLFFARAGTQHSRSGR